MFGLCTLLAMPVMADEISDVTAAAQALDNQPNYTWKQTVVVPPDSQFQPGPTDGKLEKGGFILVSTSMGGNDMKYAIKGTNGAIYSEDNGWQSLADLENGDNGGGGPGRFMGRMIRNFQTPAQQATNILASVKSLTKTDDVYSGDLTDAGAKTLLSFRGGRGGRGGGPGGGGPDISDAKGSAKFWVSNGTLTKFEYKVTGTMSFNGNDNAVDRDTTVEITDVGTTKVDLPDDAKKKLQ
ncbi:MAG: hypothetical protein ACLQSR_00050 [Limisphaerales bacterium]